eukprot:CAMPEP_0178989448 /NCGR_PEP_ID=MMETSP0795-20121207/4371_1 /TAXON_ID=88552 /ORGANISM="Amoebophrya sp., Strain Ameob2" /LENGTH=31 /DNA_ID= /DNA_START= /DNA_END= /DNA_ORIENTATION=
MDPNPYGTKYATAYKCRTPSDMFREMGSPSP